MRCMPPLARKGVVEGPTSSAIQVIVTFTKGICVVNGVLYFNLSNAMEHVLATKETSTNLQECNYLRLSLPKLQECLRIRNLCCLNQMDLCRSCFR